MYDIMTPLVKRVPDKKVNYMGNNSESIVNSSEQSIGSHGVRIIAVNKIDNACANCHRLQRDLLLSQQRSSMRKVSIQNHQTNPGIIELIKTVLIERRVLVRLAELGYKKLRKYRDTVKDLQMSSNMTEILLKDLCDYAQLKNNTFHLNEDFFDLEDLVRTSLKTL